MALGIAALFTEGFQFRVSRLIASGGGVAEIATRFRELFPRKPIPHVNTFNALLNRVRLSNSIAERLNRGVKPRAMSYPTVPAGVDCEGFLYRLVVPVIRPEYGSGGVTRTIDIPVEIQSATALGYDQLAGLVPGAIEAMQRTRDNYELLRLGVVADRFATGQIRVTDAYRC